MGNIWHDMDPKRISPEDFIAVIEIPQGSKKKYELDKATGMIILDRILHTSTHYPANYGFIPRTYGDDGDPLDVLVLCSEDLDPLTLVRCYPIGYISMLDGGKNDEKIIAYGEWDITSTVQGTDGGLMEFEIPLDYRSLDRIPTYIVVVASASKYGDYFTGSGSSTMWIDDLELVYE